MLPTTEFILQSVAILGITLVGFGLLIYDMIQEHKNKKQ